jgi:hypothetical protein
LDFQPTSNLRLFSRWPLAIRRWHERELGA